MQWQYCPDNTGVAKRRRAKKAAAQAAAAAAPSAPSEPASEAHTPILPRATDLPAHSLAPEMVQCEGQPSLSGNLPTAESTGASLCVSDAGKGSTTDTGPDESSAVQPARKDKALVSDTQQLPAQVPPQVLSQLPSQLASPLPATQPTASVLIEPAHVSDMGTCSHAEEPPKPNPDAFQPPVQPQFSHEEDSSHTARQLAMQEPTDTSPDLPKVSLVAQEDTATPDHPAPPKLGPLTASPQPSSKAPMPGVQSPHPSSNVPNQGGQSGAEDVPERTPNDLAGTLCEPESACQATAAPTAAQEAAPPPAPQAHHERAVPEWSPEPRAATEKPQAVMGPEHVAQALHNAFAMYAKSRSRSQDIQQQQQQQQQQQLRQLSVHNPFRVSPEALQRPALPLNQLPAAAQESTQTPAQNCPARAASRSMSPEALHVLQLGIADQQSPTVHNIRCNKSASRSKSPEALLLAASTPCRDTLPALTVATSPTLDDTVPKITAPAGWKPSAFLCVNQVDSEHEDTMHSSTEEVCPGSERRAGHTLLSRSSSPALEIMVMQNKLGRQHVQLADQQTDAHPCLEDMPSCDEFRRFSSV